MWCKLYRRTFDLTTFSLLNFFTFFYLPLEFRDEVTTTFLPHRVSFDQSFSNKSSLLLSSVSLLLFISISSTYSKSCIIDAFPSSDLSCKISFLSLIIVMLPSSQLSRNTSCSSLVIVIFPSSELLLNMSHLLLEISELVFFMSDESIISRSIAVPMLCFLPTHSFQCLCVSSSIPLSS